MAQRHPHRCSSPMQQHNDSIGVIATNDNTMSPSPPRHNHPPQRTLQNDDDGKLFRWRDRRPTTTRRSKRRLFAASFVFFFCVMIIVLDNPPLGRRAAVVVVVARGSDYERGRLTAAMMKEVQNPNHSSLTSPEAAAAAAANFFDCHHPDSKCIYFNPSTFLHAYYASLGNNNDSDSDYIQRYRRRIGFYNHNLPALDVLSWWSLTTTTTTTTTTNNDDDVGYNANYSNANSSTIPLQRRQFNVTYVHVHKCGGTSIQGALYSSARAIRRQRQQQQGLMTNDTSTSNTMTMAMVHTYKYSFGGGSRSKKESRDKARLDYIRSIATTQQQYQHQHQHQQRMKLNSSSSSSLVNDHHTTATTTTTTTTTTRATTTIPSSSNHPIIFTIVRDPIERFLSGIQQIMHYNIDLRSKCLFEKNYYTTTMTDEVSGDDEERILRQRTIGCAITDIETTNYRNDVHLQPMMAHFRLLDGDGAGLAPPNPRQQQQQQQHDDEGKTSSGVTISVFAMEDINFVLSHLLGQGQQLQQHYHNSTIVRRPNNDDTSSSSSSTKKIIHARDRSDATYATSTILASLSVADCTDDMIQRLCTLYQVDVEMMRYIGFGGFAVDICP